ncbi:MAG: hypothetical protein M5U19_19945 [Microthrixaceae bacterium]|nr:hypothetical protein [Microthrixaceae bacterium]
MQLFCEEFDLDPLSRPLTVYGGLAFAGGPWNNPVGHALATMVDRLRGSDDAFGLVTANGGNVDKHAFGVLGTAPPPNGFRHDCPQAEIEAAATPRKVLQDYSGPATVGNVDRDARPFERAGALPGKLPSPHRAIGRGRPAPTPTSWPLR